jgi:hypothetical protein
VSDGLKVTPWLAVPAFGAVEGVVKVNNPSTLATPPLNMEESNVCPYPIDVAVGITVIIGVALFTARIAMLLVTAPYRLETSTE